ncbi:adenylosuccinate synthetase [Vibrio variabilis]|uniref:Adenylosuccinate synthetase n=1 Tax=Vibrio variabilis TaxID=990271 RepID=A0ABQ0J714_9VIBR|nr:adenylosuccinate synthetase [Vibrio variabilis]
MYHASPVSYEDVLEQCKGYAGLLTSMIIDVTDELDAARKRGDKMMFEGAQGTLLDIDHGTYLCNFFKYDSRWRRRRFWFWS